MRQTGPAPAPCVTVPPPYIFPCSCLRFVKLPSVAIYFIPVHQTKCARRMTSSRTWSSRRSPPRSMASSRPSSSCSRARLCPGEHPCFLCWIIVSNSDFLVGRSLGDTPAVPCGFCDFHVVCVSCVFVHLCVVFFVTDLWPRRSFFVGTMCM